MRRFEMNEVSISWEWLKCQDEMVSFHEGMEKIGWFNDSSSYCDQLQPGLILDYAERCAIRMIED